MVLYSTKLRQNQINKSHYKITCKDEAFRWTILITSWNIITTCIKFNVYKSDISYIHYTCTCITKYILLNLIAWSPTTIEMYQLVMLNPKIPLLHSHESELDTIMILISKLFILWKSFEIFLPHHYTCDQLTKNVYSSLFISFKTQWTVIFLISPIAWAINPQHPTT